MNKMFYVSDTVSSTYAELANAVSHIAQLLTEEKVYAVCCNSLPLTLAVMYAVSERKCKAVLIENGAADGFVSGIMKKSDACAVITDNSELCKDKAILISEDIISLSETAEISFEPPEIIYPYSAPDGTEQLYRFDAGYLSGIAALTTKKLMCDFAETFVSGISDALYGIPLAFAVIGAGGCIYDNVRPQNASCAVMAISAAGSSSINKCLKAKHIITYGADASETLGGLADYSEKNNIKYYNFLGYPVFSFITKACSNSREFYHVGKPLPHISACIADKKGKPVIRGGNGLIYVSDTDEPTGTVLINGMKMRSTGMKGYAENGTVVFTDSQYMIYRNRYFSVGCISDAADISANGIELHDGKIYVQGKFSGKTENLCRMLYGELPGWYHDVNFVPDSERYPWEQLDIRNAENLRRYISADADAEFDNDGILNIITAGETEAVNKKIEQFMTENCPEIRTQKFVVHADGRNDFYEFTASEKEMTEDEKAVLEIWRSVLNCPELSRYDNFIDNGGTSFELIKGFYRIKQMTGREISVSECVTMDTPEKTFALLQKSDDDKAYSSVGAEQLFSVCIEMQSFPDEDELVLPVLNNNRIFMTSINDIRTAAEKAGADISFMPYELWHMALEEHINSADKRLCSDISNFKYISNSFIQYILIKNI